MQHQRSEQHVDREMVFLTSPFALHFTDSLDSTQSPDTTCWGGVRGGCNSRNSNHQGGPTSYSHLITPAANGAFVVAGPGPTSVWTIRPNGTRLAPNTQPTVTVTIFTPTPDRKVTSGAEFNEVSRMLFMAAFCIRVSSLLGLAIFGCFMGASGIWWIVISLSAIVVILYFAMSDGLEA
jgi:hypothetical protein